MASAKQIAWRKKFAKMRAEGKFQKASRAKKSKAYVKKKYGGKR